MNLIIDQGNTCVKIAVYSKDELIVRLIEKEIQPAKIKSILKEYKTINKAILSSLTSLNPEIMELLEGSTDYFINLDPGTPIPITNNYSTRDTLGYDRIANAVGAHTIFPENNVLVVDAGTAITFDLVTAAGEFAGGNISPGMSLRFKALNHFTSKLPLVEKNDKFPMLGKTTHDAVLSGVITSVILEIDGYINKLKEEYPDLQIVLTGGDADFFVKKLKNMIFVDLNITLSGLNRILEYNTEKKL